MKKALLATGAALFILSATPTLAAYDNYRPQTYRPAAAAQMGDNTSAPSKLVVLGMVVAVTVAKILIEVARNSSSSAHGLPKELRPRESVEHYDQEASRTRAYTRKLDADTALAESQLRASMKEDELKEFENYMRDKKSSRRRK